MEVHVSIKAETLWSVDLGPLGTLNITNSFLTMVIVMAALLLFGAWMARKATIIPGRLQSLYEVMVEFIRDLVDGTAGRSAGRRILPLCGAIFFFLIVSNYSGLLPGVGTIGKYETHAEETTETTEETEEAEGAAEEHHEEEVLVPFFRSPSADLNMTLAMALITFTVVQVVGLRQQGFGGRIKHMADPWFLFPIEVVSELARIVSLSFRLFGNVFAGEVLLTVMYAIARSLMEKTYYIFFFAFGIPTIFLLLEVLFGFVQALVFALLTVIYISLVMGGHGEHEHEEEQAHPAAQPAPAPAGAGD